MPRSGRAAGFVGAVLLFVLLAAGEVGAQALRAAPLSPAERAVLVAGRADLAAVASARPSEAPPRRATALRGRTLAGTVGGAVVGAFLGYFASQVLKSDWEDDAGTAGTNRRAYAVGGAALGAVVGYAVMRERPPGATGPVRRDGPPSYDDGNIDLIVRNEIVSSGAANAYDLVQTRRPRWLSTRGVNTFRESGRVVSADERSVILEKAKDETIVVYLDQARLGGVETLRDIPASSIASIRYLDARTASYRYGSGHDHGAIVVMTQQ